MPKNYEARDAKLAKRKGAMKVNSRGLLTVTLPTIAKKGRQENDRKRSMEELARHSRNQSHH